jgi:hypothetical protein
MRRLVAILALLSGCDLYWGNSGDDDVCNGSGYDYPTGGAQQQLRNPETGECQFVGGGGGGCNTSCGPCPEIAIAPLPDWGSCYSSCESLDESSCLTATGCYAAYIDNLNGGHVPPGTAPTFRGCWQVAPSGPVHGSCTNLDAQECSRHDDCSALFVDTFGPADEVLSTSFERCAPEPTSTGCSAVDCGPGSHCEEQCYPCGPNQDCAGTCQSMCVPDDSCATVDCGPGYTCVETCSGMGGNDAPGSTPPGQCFPSCVLVNTGEPGSCTGAINCQALPPACPANTTAGIANGCYTGYCIPLSACGPTDPGTCGTAACATPPPQCPANTVPGVTNGCWSGFCIPASACPQPACETLTTANSCTARSDCSPVYLGDDCTCYPGYCECNILTFERCGGSLMPF